MGLQTAAAAARTAQFVRQAMLADTAFATLLREDGHAVADVPLARRHAGAGETLVDEGQPAPALCFLADGWACRYVTTPDGRRQVSTILLPGDVCNLDAGVAERSGHGVRMLTPGTVLTLPLRGLCAATRCGFRLGGGAAGAGGERRTRTGRAAACPLLGARTAARPAVRAEPPPRA